MMDGEEDKLVEANKNIEIKDEKKIEKDNSQTIPIEINKEKKSEAEIKIYKIPTLQNEIYKIDKVTENKKFTIYKVFKIIGWVIFFIFVGFLFLSIIKFKRLTLCDNEQIFDASNKMDMIKIELNQNNKNLSSVNKNFQLFIHFKDMGENLIKDVVN